MRKCARDLVASDSLVEIHRLQGKLLQLQTLESAIKEPKPATT